MADLYRIRIVLLPWGAFRYRVPPHDGTGVVSQRACPTPARDAAFLASSGACAQRSSLAPGSVPSLGKPGDPPVALSVAAPGTTTTGTTARDTVTGTRVIPPPGLGSASPARLHARAGRIKVRSGEPRVRSGVAMMIEGARPRLPRPVSVLAMFGDGHRTAVSGCWGTRSVAYRASDRIEENGQGTLRASLECVGIFWVMQPHVR